LRDLLIRFEEIFLSDGGVIVSPCGHAIHFLDDHFFHLVGIDGTWSMEAERVEIMTTAVGFGKWTLKQNGSRARRLLAARETMLDPDEVMENNPNARDKWVYVKEFAGKRDPFTVALIKERPEDRLVLQL
jgi:hypothetical protein